MSINKNNFQEITKELSINNVKLIAVSKLKSVDDIMSLNQLGQIDFGENYVQELVEKYGKIGNQVNWHFIGHLQSNKVKYIAPFVSMIHSVDSLKLLQEINKQGKKNNRVIDCLLQVYIAKEETKFGLDEVEIKNILTEIKQGNLANIAVKGYMGMASFTNNEETIKQEFRYLKQFSTKFDLPNCSSPIMSIGMSQDYKIAIQEGSNMVRIGSLLFGAR